MRFYLAARYSRRLELCEYRSDLTKLGHEVPARWLLGEHEVSDPSAAEAVEADGPIPAEQARLFAKDDMEDLLSSDILVCFTEPPRSPLGARGGRHVEFGMALGLRYLGHSDRGLYVVGPRENIFYCHEEVDGCFETWDEFLEHLDAIGAHAHHRLFDNEQVG